MDQFSVNSLSIFHETRSVVINCCSRMLRFGTWFFIEAAVSSKLCLNHSQTCKYLLEFQVYEISINWNFTL